ncbi:MAG: hypothetical protein J7474_03310 [Arthrobacter sp.]|nr:hypothetical protein [Arthrobacter sp.]
MSILNKTRAPEGHVERKAETTASDRVVAGSSHVVLILWSAKKWVFYDNR